MKPKSSPDCLDQGCGHPRFEGRCEADRPLTTEYIRSLKEAEGGAWSTAQFVGVAGISPEALQKRREAFTIVYWTDSMGHCHYPKWQFDANLHVHPNVREILGILHTHDTLRALTTFLVPFIGEPGVSALQLIKAGSGERAVEHIRALASEH